MDLRSKGLVKDFSTVHKVFFLFCNLFFTTELRHFLHNWQTPSIFFFTVLKDKNVQQTGASRRNLEFEFLSGFRHTLPLVPQLSEVLTDTLNINQN